MPRLRMYFVQTWHGLADEAVKDAVNDLQALRNSRKIIDGILMSRRTLASTKIQVFYDHDGGQHQ